jgi:hypothetical protein
MAKKSESSSAPAAKEFHEAFERVKRFLTDEVLAVFNAQPHDSKSRAKARKDPRGFLAGVGVKVPGDVVVQFTEKPLPPGVGPSPVDPDWEMAAMRAAFPGWVCVRVCMYIGNKGEQPSLQCWVVCSPRGLRGNIPRPTGPGPRPPSPPR